MRKRIRKLTSLLLAFWMAWSLAVPASAQSGRYDDGTYYRYYLLGSDQDKYSNDTLVSYGHMKSATGACNYRIGFEMTLPDGTKVKDVGTHYVYGGTELLTLHTGFYTQNNKYWYLITGKTDVIFNLSGNEHTVDMGCYNLLSIGSTTKSYLYFRAIGTGISIPEADAYCTVQVASKIAHCEENRRVVVKVNGKVVGETIAAFPNRDGETNSTGSGGTTTARETDLVVKQNAPDRYYYTCTATSDSGTGYQKTYYLNFYDYSYLLSFSSPEGWNVPDPVSFGPTAATSHTFSIPAQAPSRPGYTFAGWNTNAGGTGTSYQPGGQITLEGVNGTNGITGQAKQTLYAIWSRNRYSVAFHGNGATEGSMENQSFSFGTAGNLSPVGYRKTCTVTFDPTGGTSDKASESAYAAFLGWEDRGSVVYEGVTYRHTDFDAAYYGTKNEDVFRDSEYGGGAFNKLGLLAHYVEHGKDEGRSPVGETPGYYPDGAKVSNLAFENEETVPLYASWGDARVTLPGASMTGYIFLGWYTSETGGDRVGGAGDLYACKADTTLYAQWKPHEAEYTVEHYLQNADDFDYPTEPADTDTKDGLVGKETEAEAKDYPGFAPKEFDQKVIAPSGTVVKIYYERNSYQLTWKVDYDDDDLGFVIHKTGSARFGAQLPELDLDVDYYDFSGWFWDEDCRSPLDDDDVMPMENAVLYGRLTRKTTSMTVTKSGMKAGEKAIFLISGPGLGNGLQVILSGNGGSVTISGLRVGETYTVTEQGSWSWRYGSAGSKTVKLSENADHNLASFSNGEKQIPWLSGESTRHNVFGKSGG